MKRAMAAMAILLSGWGSILAADELPALFQVALPAQYDFLNVRNGPGTHFSSIGQLQPNRMNVEGVARSADREWLRIIWGETSAWVFAPYLKRQVDDGYPIARRLNCQGNEPFWSLELTQNDSVTFSTIDGDRLSSQAGQLVKANGRNDRFILGGSDFVSAIVRRTTCSDGMTDRLYGMDVDVMITRGGTELYSGCCRITP